MIYFSIPTAYLKVGSTLSIFRFQLHRNVMDVLFFISEWPLCFELRQPRLLRWRMLFRRFNRGRTTTIEFKM